VIKKSVVCIGAALIDESFTCLASPMPGTSNPATFHKSPGGVARNIAHHLALLGHSVELLSHFGNDADGKWLINECNAVGIRTAHSLINNSPTGRFAALLSPHGDLFAGAASGYFEKEITIHLLKEKIPLFQSASLLLLDCNLTAECLTFMLTLCYNENIPCIIETVSVPKASRLVHAELKNVLLITPNLDELSALTGNIKNSGQSIQQVLERGVKYLWIRNGKSGSALYSTNLQYELPAPGVKVVDTTGAGDAALAGWIHAWLHNKKPDICIQYGHAMASLILQVHGAIDKNLTGAILEKTFEKLQSE
jgi:pseudouridine kinase